MGQISPLELINFARKKLYGELRDPDRSDLAARLTPFAVCANLKVSPVSALSGDFVASHLATLVGVSEDRTALYIRYPSEPILAEVALTSTGGMPMSDWIGDMNDLTKLFVQGSGAGDRGDFIGLLLLLLAKYRAVKSKSGIYLSEEVPLTTYLEQLFGVECVRNCTTVHVDQQQRAHDLFLSSSYISATHFVECSGSASPFNQTPDEVLERLYMTRTGLVLPENWEGADVLIPVRTVGSSPSASNYSIILVQIKNAERDADYPDSATKKLSSKYVFENQKNCNNLWKDVPCIRMYMQLGDDKPEPAVCPVVTPSNSIVAEKYYALAAFGLSAQVYPCLNLNDKTNGRSADLANDLSDLFRRFLRPPEWLSPIPSSDMNTEVEQEDKDSVNQMIWRHARKMIQEM